MEITVVRTETIEQKFMSKQNAFKYFGFNEKSLRTFERYLSEFKMHSEFGEGYINPTGGFVLVDFNKFESFLRWKSANKFK